MTSKVEIISKALNLLGHPPVSDISGFPGNNPVYAAASTWYDTLLKRILGEGQPWRFAMTYKQLSVLTDESDRDDWAYILQFPTDPNYILSYRVTDRSGIEQKDYVVYEDKIYANQNELWMDYTYQPTPDAFPIYFEMYLIYELAAHLAMPVTQKSDIAKIWIEEAKTQKKQARTIDSKFVPSVPMPAGPLFDAHY